MDYSQTIKDNYAQQLKDKIAAQNASNSANKLKFTQNIGKADTLYGGLKGDAYTQNAVDKRNLAENMANMGMGAGGGTSLTASHNLKNNLLGNLASADLKKQGYIDEQNAGIAQADINNQAAIANITAENKMNLNTALLDQIKYMQDYYTNLYLNDKLSSSDYNKYMDSLGG